MNKHIFLADDDSDDRQVFSEALQEVDESAVLVEAEDGAKLMQILQVPPRPLPDLVFLDINMPRQNGFQCLSEIRQHKDQLKDLKVIMFTTSNNRNNIETAYQLGASLYAVKPNSYSSFKTMLKTILERDWSVPTPEKKDFVLR